MTQPAPLPRTEPHQRLNTEAQPPFDPDGEAAPPLRPELLHELSHSKPVYSVSFSPDGTTLVTGSNCRLIKIWDAKSGKLVRTLKGHTGPVYSVNFSADGKLLASGAWDKAVKLWEIQSGNLLHTLKGHFGPILSVNFSPDGQSLASGAWDKTVKIWDVLSGALLHTLEGHFSWISSVHFNSNGQILASGSGDNTIKLWNARSGTLLHTLKGHRDSVWSVSFSPDGQTLVSGSEDKTIKLWDVPSGILLRTLDGHTGRVLSVSFRSDGQVLASGASDKTAKLWDLRNGTILHTLKEHAGPVNSVSFNALSQTFASGSMDRTVKLWDAASGALLRILVGHFRSVYSVSFSPDGKTLASGSGDRMVKLWNAANGVLYRTLEGHTDSIHATNFSPDGKILASGALDRTVKLWDAESGALLHTLGNRASSTRCVSFSPDGKNLALGEDKTVKLWNVVSGELVQILEGHSGSINSVSFSPDGKILASGGKDKTINLWDMMSGSLFLTLKEHTDSIDSVSFSSDSKILASGAQDGTVKLWDVASGALLRALEGDPNTATFASFSSTGKLAVFQAWSRKVNIWDTQSGALLYTLEGSDIIESICFAPDSKTLALGTEKGSVRLLDMLSGVVLRTLDGCFGSGNSTSFSSDGKALALGGADHRVKLWNAVSGALVRTWKGHSGSVNSVSFSPNGKTLASGAADHTVRLWDAANGALIQILEGHSDSVTSVSFSVDGKILASGSWDLTVKLWDVRSGTLLHTLEGHDGFVECVSFCSDSKTLAIGTWHGNVKLWNINTQSGTLPRTIKGHSHIVNTLSFSPNGKILASGSNDKTIRLWQIPGGVLLRTLEGHSDPVSSVSFSTNGKILASGADDRTVKLWDVASGALLRTLEGHSGSVNSVSFSPNGKTLASVSSDGAVKLWNVSTGKLLRQFQSWSDGDWMAYRWDREPTRRLLRAERGTRIQVQDSLLKPWYSLDLPRPVAGTPRLIVLPTQQPVRIPDGTTLSDIPITIRNEGDAPALRVQLRLPESLPDGWFAHAPHYRSRLDPGQEITLPVNISRLAPVDPKQPEAGPQPVPSYLLQAKADSFYTQDDPAAFSIPVQGIVPQLGLKSLEVLRSQGQPSALQLSLQNAPGAQDPTRLTITVDLFDSKTNEKLASAGQALSIRSLPPGTSSTPLAFALPLDPKASESSSTIDPQRPLPSLLPVLLEHADSIVAQVQVQGAIWPTHRWSFRQAVELASDFETSLRGGEGIPARQAAAYDQRLKQANRLEPLLQSLSILPARWANLVRANADPVGALFQALRLQTTPPEPLQSGLQMHRLSTQYPWESEPTAKALFLLTGPSTPEQLKDWLEDALRKSGWLNRHSVLLDRTEAQNVREGLKDARRRLAILNERELSQTLLHERPLELICQFIARDATLGEISPYQTSGGVKREMQFVGRENELAALMEREDQNYLLVGSRQIGKTSILQSLQRQHPDRGHLIVLEHDPDLESVLGKKNHPSLDEMARQPASERPPIYLFDEVDLFIQRDRQANYPVCRRLRSLAEERRARFVLAGYWELYSAVYLEYQSPLKNFANPLSIGPLTEAAARELATRPLQALGIRWANPELPNELIHRAGRRPNLIATACDAAIRQLPALSDRVLTRQMLEAALEIGGEAGGEMADAFGHFMKLVSAPRAQLIDRMVLFATVSKDWFSRTELELKLEVEGVEVPPAELDESLKRLLLAYAIQEAKREGKPGFVFPVPLLKDYLLSTADGAPARRLRQEAKQWLQPSTGAAPA